eukprot:CAMPEP_0113932516 /NCGR_PEP_ID=MMETSP1159-20121227/7156_1 /TAXON_ID=88271 /ORGANISM="Picocystis salinarum" /LENGTH=552 /DNA_ID=CAMNT_0000933633 /DNA_START=100 /DNA_END=1758 /DNA_ORIENTATION=- /assembly_acc=CAM_ASM_000767
MEKKEETRPRWQDYDTVFTNAKAGMDQVDPDHVKRVVYELSKGSPHFVNEQRKMEANNERIQKMVLAKEQLREGERSRLRKVAESILGDLELTRDLSRTWMHVDMDCFFFAVEALKDPSLHNRPVAVGGKSMISTANYEARKYGVRSAMPPFIAMHLCPQLLLINTNFDEYSKASQFLAKRSVSAWQLAEELREEVHAATGLTCSVGIAANRRLAKVCSDINKPNGQYCLPNHDQAIRKFVETLPVRKISGIGKVMEKVLKDAVGVTVCGELIEKRDLVVGLFSPSSAAFLLAVSLGIGATEHEELEEGKVGRRGMSCERTFKETADKQFLVEKCKQMVHHLVEDLSKEGLKGKTITLKMKTAGFEIKSRSVTLAHFTCSETEIIDEALKLLNQELPVRLRLLGVRMSNFEEKIMLPKGQTSLDKLFAEGEKADLPSTTGTENQLLENELLRGDRTTTFPWSRSGWSCKSCTFFNQDGRERSCAICGERKGSLTSDSCWCIICDALVLKEKMSEHEDYHLALQFEKRERLLNGLEPIPKRGRQATLSEIFTK